MSTSCEQVTGRKPGPTCTVNRIGRAPAPGCQGCTKDICKASWCPLRGEQPNLPDHVLRSCPGLMGTRLRRTGNINLALEEVQGTELVAATTSAVQSRLTTLLALSEWEGQQQQRSIIGGSLLLHAGAHPVPW